jgi:drug/metabolite transporter (DMT)-like permease
VREFARPTPVRIENIGGRAPSRAVLTAAITFLMAIWSVNFIIGKIALRYLAPLTLASFRVFLAGFCMALLYPLCRRLANFRKTPTGDSSDSSTNPAASANPIKNVIPSAARDLLVSSSSHKPRLTSHDLWTFLYLAFFGVVLNQVCFTVGLSYTSIAHSAIIVGLGPIYALILAILFGVEKASARKIIGMTIALAGVIIMTGGPRAAQRSATHLGDAITFTGSLSFALYAVLSKRVAARYNTLTMTTWSSLFGALLVAPLAIRQARELGPLANWFAIPWQGWAGLLFMAVFSSVLAYLIYFWLLRYLEVTQLSSFSYLIPPSATVLGIIFLGERGSWIELLGGALALAGVYSVESSRDA